MRNFGLLKSIVENALVKTYKTEDFKQIIKEFRDFIKDHKFVGELYVEYGSLMKTKGLNEEVAKEFLGLSVDFIKSTINNNKREFEQFDAWVETLGENVENQYELLDNMVFAKTADDFTKLVESRKQMWKLMSDVKEESTLTESINIPLESMFGVAADTFAKEYSQLSESELFELKSILRMSQDELNEGIERLKTEVLGKLSVVNESDEDTNNKLSETKQRIEKYINTVDENWHDGRGRTTMKIKYEHGGSMYADGGSFYEENVYVLFKNKNGLDRIIEILNEKCTEANGQYLDKSLILVPLNP